MALAVKYGYEKNRKMCGWLILATAIGGLTFVGMQVFEWSKLIHEGVRPWENPFGAKQFGSFCGQGDHMTNYQSALARFKKATTAEELNRLERSLERVYNAGCFTVSEYARLDRKLVARLWDLSLVGAFVFDSWGSAALHFDVNKR